MDRLGYQQSRGRVGRGTDEVVRADGEKEIDVGEFRAVRVRSVCHVFCEGTFRLSRFFTFFCHVFWEAEAKGEDIHRLTIDVR
jgi:hypothetical protein